jgi:hypothetical protein
MIPKKRKGKPQRWWGWGYRILMIKMPTPIVPLLVWSEQGWDVMATIVNITNTTTHLCSYPFFFPWNPFLYHLLFLLPIPNPLSPHQKPFFFSSLLSYISLPLFNIFFFCFFCDVFKIKVDNFFSILHISLQLPSLLFSCFNIHLLHGITKLLFSFPNLLLETPPLSLLHTSLHLSLIHFSISEGNRKNHNDPKHNSLQQTPNEKRWTREECNVLFACLLTCMSSPAHTQTHAWGLLLSRIKTRIILKFFQVVVDFCRSKEPNKRKDLQEDKGEDKKDKRGPCRT